jgi:hypothetical protein
VTGFTIRAETLKGQRSEQRSAVGRTEDDIRGPAPVAELEECLADVIGASSSVGQRELLAIEF